MQIRMSNPEAQLAKAAIAGVRDFWCDIFGSEIPCPSIIVLGAGNVLAFDGRFPWSRREGLEIGGAPVINPITGQIIGVDLVVCESAGMGADIAREAIRKSMPVPNTLTREASQDIAKRTRHFGNGITFAEILGPSSLIASTCGGSGFPMIAESATLGGKVLIRGHTIYGPILMFCERAEDAALFAQAGVDVFNSRFEACVA